MGNLINFVDRPKVHARAQDGTVLSCTRIAGTPSSPIRWVIEVTHNGEVIDHPSLPARDMTGPIRYTTRQLNFIAESVGFKEWWSTWISRPVRRSIE